MDDIGCGAVNIIGHKYIHHPPTRIVRHISHISMRDPIYIFFFFFLSNINSLKPYSKSIYDVMLLPHFAIRVLHIILANCTLNLMADTHNEHASFALYGIRTTKINFQHKIPFVRCS